MSSEVEARKQPSMSALPIVDLPGDPYADGVAHGRAAGDGITQNLRIYYDRFQREAKLTLAQTRERGRMYHTVIERLEPAYARAMEGVRPPRRPRATASRPEAAPRSP